VYIDFQELKERVSLDQVAHMLGLKLKAGRTTCPACKGDDRSLAVTSSKGFYCYKSQKGGDQIALVAHVRDCGMKEAAEIIARHYLPQHNSPQRHPPKEDEMEEPAGGNEARFTELEGRVAALEDKLFNVIAFRAKK
jgi:phage/plasmid primase-like uncharacterized protein